MVRPHVRIPDIRPLSSFRLGIPTTTTTTNTTTTTPPIPTRPPNRLIVPPVMTESQASWYSQSTSHEDVDIEQQRLLSQVLSQDDILSGFPIVMTSSPTIPRMSFTRPRRLPERRLEPLRPLPLPPPPDQEEIRERMKRKTRSQTVSPSRTRRKRELLPVPVPVPVEKNPRPPTLHLNNFDT